MLSLVSIVLGLYLFYAGVFGVNDYDFLRSIVFIFGLLYLYLLTKEDNIEEVPKSFYVIFSVSMIILFNPFSPIYFNNRDLWIMIDIVTALILFTTIIYIKAPNEPIVEDLEKIFSKPSLKIMPTNTNNLVKCNIQFLPIISNYIENNHVLEELTILMNEQNKFNTNVVKFNRDEHTNLIYYHLVCYIASLIKIHLSSYNKVGTDMNFYISKLEEDLIYFKHHSYIEKYEVYRPIEYNEEIIFDPFCKLASLDLPYVSQVKYGAEDYRNVSILLVTNLAFIFQPTSLKDSGVPFQSFVSSLAKHAMSIIKNHHYNNHLKGEYMWV